MSPSARSTRRLFGSILPPGTIDSFARWARKTLAPALRATELQSWDDLHNVCGRFGVVVPLHGNGLVFEDAERGVRVKASCVDRNFSKPRLCKQLGDFRSVFAHSAHRAGEPVEGLRAVPQQRPTRAPTCLEQLPRFRLPPTSATQGEVSTPATASRRPTRVEPRPKTPFTTTGAPPGHRISRPQAEARKSTEGDSEDPAPWHVASFRSQPRCEPRHPCDSTSAATRAAARFARSREGLIGTMNGLSELFRKST